MKWTRFYIKNFLSIEEADIELDNRGLVLIEGKNKLSEAYQSNGSGKSSLFEGILYAIYDSTSKGLKADDIINNTHKKNTVVILEGVKGEDTYRIERYRKHSKNKNKVKLFLNDKEISEKSTKDTNKVIEETVGIDYNTFVNSVMFTQENGAGRFATASDKEKKEILENLVNLDIYAKAQEIAKGRVKGVQSKIDDTIRAHERLTWDLANIDSLEQQDQERYEHTKALIQQEQQNIKDKTEELKEYTGTYFPERDKKEQYIEEMRNKLDSISVSDLSDLYQKTNQAYNDLQNKIYRKKLLENNKTDYVSMYKKLQSDTHCPVCGNELDATHRSKEMKEIKDSVRDVLTSIVEVDKEIENLENTYNQINEEYQAKTEEENKVKSEYQMITQEIENAQAFIRSYDYEVQKLKDASATSQETLNKLNDIPKPTPRDDERRAIKEKMENCRSKERELEQEKLKLENVVKVYSNSGVKSHVLDLITPFLNERANKYLSILTDSGIEVLFSTQKKNKSGELTDKFDVQVVNKGGGENYQSNSGGEKKRIDIAISLAIQDLVMSKSDLSMNMVVYDEIFDALDDIGSENVISILRERLEVVNSIFVITHNDHLKNLFENTITVTKVEKGLSKVEEGEKTS